MVPAASPRADSQTPIADWHLGDEVVQSKKTPIDYLIEANARMMRLEPVHKQNAVRIPQTSASTVSNLKKDNGRKSRKPFSMRADVVKKTILWHFKKHLLEDYDKVVQHLSARKWVTMGMEELEQTSKSLASSVFAHLPCDDLGTHITALIAPKTGSCKKMDFSRTSPKLKAMIHLV